MALFREGEDPVVIPTHAREVFDVSGAGDTVIGTYTLALAAGADPISAAVINIIRELRQGQNASQAYVAELLDLRSSGLVGNIESPRFPHKYTLKQSFRPM